MGKTSAFSWSSFELKPLEKCVANPIQYAILCLV